MDISIQGEHGKRKPLTSLWIPVSSRWMLHVLTSKTFFFLLIAMALKNVTYSINMWAKIAQPISVERNWDFLWFRLPHEIWNLHKVYFYTQIYFKNNDLKIEKKSVRKMWLAFCSNIEWFPLGETLEII